MFLLSADGVETDLADSFLSIIQVGNKRLKVQHKQIRPKDLHNDHDDDGGFGMPPIGGGSGYSQFQSLPPSGAMASQNLWYGRKEHDSKDGDPNEGPELTTTAATETDNSLQYGPVESGGLATMSSLQNALPDVAGNVLE